MQRIASLDITKGFFIILMTVTHIGLAQLESVSYVNEHWFFLFKMPGFYIISGYLMYNSIGSSGFVWRKVDGIYKPCLALILIMLAIGWLRSYLLWDPQPFN